MSVVTSRATVFASSPREIRTPGIAPPASRLTVPLMEPPLACALAKPGAAKLQMRAKAAAAIVDFIEELVDTRFHPDEGRPSKTYQAEQSCTNDGKLIMKTLNQS